MNNIANNIKLLRKERGLSQEQFAQALHVTRQTVSSWERGMSRPGLETLQQMADVLEVNAEQLLYGSEKGGKPFYHPVSFWPVVAVLPLFFFMTFFILPLIMSLFINAGTDTGILLCGQMFLAMLITACYCLLKDQIRNREYYDKTEKNDREDDL